MTSAFGKRDPNQADAAWSQDGDEVRTKQPSHIEPVQEDLDPNVVALIDDDDLPETAQQS